VNEKFVIYRFTWVRSLRKEIINWKHRAQIWNRRLAPNPSRYKCDCLALGLNIGLSWKSHRGAQGWDHRDSSMSPRISLAAFKVGHCGRTGCADRSSIKHLRCDDSELRLPPPILRRQFHLDLLRRPETSVNAINSSRRSVALLSGCLSQSSWSRRDSEMSMWHIIRSGLSSVWLQQSRDSRIVRFTFQQLLSTSSPPTEKTAVRWIQCLIVLIGRLRVLLAKLVQLRSTNHWTTISWFDGKLRNNIQSTFSILIHVGEIPLRCSLRDWQYAVTFVRPTVSLIRPQFWSDVIWCFPSMAFIVR
jgi:hypothetical protein